MRRSLPLLAVTLVTLAGCQDSSSLSPVGPRYDAGGGVTAQQIPGRYIVVFKKGAVSDPDSRARTIMTGEGGRERQVYRRALQGFVADLSPAAVARIQSRSDVAMVEQDQIVRINITQTPTPSWGLDRIDQFGLPLNNSYSYTVTGTGVRLYAIDTGILYSHGDFGGRASPGIDEVTPGGGAVDCNGHGTHTASTAAGATYGVAKNMTIIGVRVLDCSGSGTTSGVIAGIDWVTQNAVKPAVANMSLGGGFSSALNTAVANSIASGVVYAIAAGNSAGDACLESPSSTAAAITVAATTTTDTRASYSNFGSCVDLFAPGSGITAAWIGSNSATNTISGTSMATPHVAGVAGLYLEQNPTATPAQVAAAIIGNASSGLVASPGSGSPNKLLNMSFIANGGGGGTNQPPVASWTYSCTSNLVCTFNGTSSTDDQGIATYTWNIGSRPPANGAIVTYQWFSRPTIQVTLTVTDAGGLTSSLTRTITIAPTGGTNQPPTALITAPATGSTFNAGASITFTGSGSDPEDGALTGAALTWTSSINGAMGTGTSVTTSSLSAGTHTITLTSKDAQNATGTATISITVRPPNQAPTATITAPASGTSVVQGTSVTFTGSGSDPEDGALTGASLAWTSSLDGAIGSGTSFSTSALSVGTHTITLTATDSQNATGLATITVTVTAPSGNSPPVAAWTWSCTPSRLCTFDGTGSTDDHGIVQYTWVIGTRPPANGAVVSFQWYSAKTVQVALTVTDAGGLTNTLTRTINIP